MKTALLGLLFATLVIESASIYFRRAVRSEAGRIHLLPALRPVMRVMNPRTARAVERRQSPFGVLHHVGRRRVSNTTPPVAAARTSDGVLVPLMYGPGTYWCRNILAAGRCTLTFDGEELALAAPEVVRAAIAETNRGGGPGHRALSIVEVRTSCRIRCGAGFFHRMRTCLDQLRASFSPACD
jgi:hypothetical protein